MSQTPTDSAKVPQVQGGGTYGQLDFSPAAQRSRVETTRAGESGGQPEGPEPEMLEECAAKADLGQS